MERLGILDGQRATLRILLILHEHSILTREELLEIALENMVGQAAAYSSIEALNALGLIFERKNNKRRELALTQKGVETAELVELIKKTLQ
jgi:predicted transcriptional regulator